MGVMRSQPDIDAVQMFDMARIACNMIRGDFKEHLVVFDDEVREREEYEQRLLSDLQRALDSFEFEVYYQPKYDILVAPAKLVSAEALIRWRHPELGIIPPDDFIPLFERSGKISDVDKFVWNEAARQIVRWRELYGVTIPVSVNLSRVDVFDPALEETLDEIIKFNGLDHDLLKLEVTESAYTENSEQVIKVVSSLRRKGYVIEMDDFGTGYSSLSMLSEMPVDILKLDRNFVRNIDHSEKDAQLVALILDISKELDIPVVAEGVETEAQLQMLRKLGCAIAQGYYFSRPLNVAEFENKILKESIKEDK
jgi:EAL domain-containing protein (putative c-di-GMP-specific phosphodiesterase class I)